jgi:signal transduction histidine kinase
LSYQDDAAALSVSDTGEGIDEEEIAAVFDRFYHSDAYRSSNGVGLYLVKLIADKHGFKLEVKSRKGSGTTFLLTGIS